MKVTLKLISVFHFRLLMLLLPPYSLLLPESRYMLKPVENNVGLYYQREERLKVSNDKWTLLVYKDVAKLKETYENNNNILYNLNAMLKHAQTESITHVGLLNAQKEFSIHISLLTQMSNTIADKFEELELDVSTRPRKRRGLINAAGSVWKFITGNLDASDGEYYTNCINKIEKDEHELENLMKKQIMVTTSVIKSFNETIRKLQIDEETFNKDLQKIETYCRTMG